MEFWGFGDKGFRQVTKIFRPQKQPIINRLDRDVNEKDMAVSRAHNLSILLMKVDGNDEVLMCCNCCPREKG